MSNKRRILVALGVFVLMGVLEMLGWSYVTRRVAQGQAPGAVTVEGTSPADSGPGTLREALFIVDGANGKANVVLKTGTITLQTTLPPLVNSHGVRIVAEQPGAAIDAHGLTAGPVFDLTANNPYIGGVGLRNCVASGSLLRARHLHLQSSAVASCDVGVDVQGNASNILLAHQRCTNDRVGVRF